jgi:hypothetical protein
VAGQRTSIAGDRYAQGRLANLLLEQGDVDQLRQLAHAAYPVRPKR